jgi:hypothetical protein
MKIVRKKPTKPKTLNTVQKSTDKFSKNSPHPSIPIVSRKVRQKSMNYDTNLAAL